MRGSKGWNPSVILPKLSFTGVVSVTLNFHPQGRNAFTGVVSVTLNFHPQGMPGNQEVNHITCVGVYSLPIAWPEFWKSKKDARLGMDVSGLLWPTLHCSTTEICSWLTAAQIGYQNVQLSSLATQYNPHEVSKCTRLRLVQLPSHFLMQLFPNCTQKHVITYTNYMLLSVIRV